MFATISKTRIAQEIVKMSVATTTATVTSTAVDKYTEIDEDNILVTPACALVGWYVSEKVQPLTDAAVVKIASKMPRLKIRRKTEQTPA